MRKDYGKPVVERLKKECLKRAGDDDSRLEGFRSDGRKFWTSRAYYKVYHPRLEFPT